MLTKRLGRYRRKLLFVGLLAVGVFVALYTTQTTTGDPLERETVVIEQGRPIETDVPETQLETLERLAKTDHVALLEMCLENYRENYSDYTCLFTKHERIDGEFMPKQLVDVAFRQEPFSVAMKWRTEDEEGEELTMPKGDRALYVEGQWKNQMLVRPTSGLLQALTGGYVKRTPTDKEVMESTLRPISSFGFERSLENLLAVYRAAIEAEDAKFKFVGYATIDDRKAIVIERILPAEKDYPAARTVTAIDLEYLVPVLIEGYDWQDEKFCTYSFEEITFNLDLTEEQFSLEAMGMKD
jgi:hypothetical protein